MKHVQDRQKPEKSSGTAFDATQTNRTHVSATVYVNKIEIYMYLTPFTDLQNTFIYHVSIRVNSNHNEQLLPSNKKRNVPKVCIVNNDHWPLY